MKEGLPKGLQELILYFSRFPGVGEKSASRMAFSLLQKSSEYIESFGGVVQSLPKSLSHCSQCFHLCEAEEELCKICKNPKREDTLVCILESSLDLLALEESGSYTGRYFLLGGVISPMDGIGPEELRIKELTEYIKRICPEEVIFALSSTQEGEATTVYVSEILKKYNSDLCITRVARGISLGSSIQYTDKNTLERAFSGRGGV